MSQISLLKIKDTPKTVGIKPVIVNKNGRPIATSQNIATVFEKRHDNVLQAIRNLIDSTPSDFGQSNFRLSYYINSQGKRQPMYEVTRDGFTLLAMGFTGKRAVEFKLAYINAFNEMERALTQPKTITVKQHTRKIVPVDKQKPKHWDPEACGVPISAQMRIAGPLFQFLNECTSIAELDKRRDFLLRGAINGHANISMALAGFKQDVLRNLAELKK